MPVNITTDLITLVSLVFGVIGVAIAVSQTLTAQRTRRVLESHCRSKCKDIVALTRSISSEVIDACELINAQIRRRPSAVKADASATTLLAAKVNGIRVLTQRLASFCDSLNDEHQDQFGKTVFECMDAELPERECLYVVSGMPEHPLPPDAVPAEDQSGP